MRLTQQGLKRTEIARQLKITTRTVRNVLHEFGYLNPIKVAGGKRGLEERREKLIAHHNQD